MRNGAIAALFGWGSKSDLLDATVTHGIITHASPLAVLCCVVQSLLIREGLLRQNTQSQAAAAATKTTTTRTATTTTTTTRTKTTRTSKRGTTATAAARARKRQKLEKGPVGSVSAVMDKNDADILDMNELRRMVVEEFNAWAEATQCTPCQQWLKALGHKNIQHAQEVLLGELADFACCNYYSMDFSSNSGYVVLTLKIALWALHWSFQNDLNILPALPQWATATRAGLDSDSEPDYRWIWEDSSSRGFGTLRWVAVIGGDSDTYCAVAGALLGAFYPRGIPTELLTNLQVRKEIQEIFTELQLPGLTEGRQEEI